MTPQDLIAGDKKVESFLKFQKYFLFGNNVLKCAYYF